METKMFKTLESNHATRPACTILAGLGAILVVGSSTTAFAQNRACQVAFSVTNATTLRSIQFDVDYTGAADVGELADPSECTFAPAGLGDVGVDQGTNTATVAWANTNPAFVGPGVFVTCRFDIPLQASAVPALADFVPALVEAEQSTGVPASPLPTLATSSISCVDSGSCSLTPESGCKDSTVTGKSKLSFKDNVDDTKDQGQYQWKSGAATDPSEFSDPVSVGDTWSWCVYSNGSLVRGSDVPSGGTCDGKPCWKAAGTTGFQFKGDVGGISQIKLKGSAEAGKASVAVKGKSKLGNFSSADLPLSTNVVSQLVLDNGSSTVCFENAFSAPSKNEDTAYSSKD
jgi:hypothetical protein